VPHTEKNGKCIDALARHVHVRRKEHHQAIEEFVATQFLFDKQWMALRVSCMR